ncbi:MAG: hypothetical protein J6V38_05890 [Kiritimatiellae bacterium]|nr:hypothetical protein [Kiritimatiellia bacterium]
MTTRIETKKIKGRADKLRADMKEFKARYTDGDLKRAIEDVLDKDFYGDIIQAKVEAFGLAETSFAIDLVIDGFVRIYKIRYYCDINLKVDNDENLIHVKSYTED